MCITTTYISLLSVCLMNAINAQTGAGCLLKTCPIPGQVRIDAKFDRQQFIGGCNCACDPGMADPNSANFCAEPKMVNYDPNTGQGDCSCGCPASATATVCEPPSVYDPTSCGCTCPATGASASACKAPQEFNPATCSCLCETGIIGQPCNMAGTLLEGSIVMSDCTCNTAGVKCSGMQVPNAEGICSCPESTKLPSGEVLYLETCELPRVRDPLSCECVTTTTTTPPPGPVSVTCSEVGDCQCPHGTKGTCTISCDGTTDACKDGIISCNNEGFDCIVNCLAGQACAGSAEVIGPAFGSLTVNCMGAQSCEGSTKIDGALGKDMSVICEGPQACKGSPMLNFGTGIGSLACLGAPDSCQGITETELNIPANAQAFSCTGDFCPAAAPAPFNKSPVAPMQQPKDPSFGTTRPPFSMPPVHIPQFPRF